VCGEGDMFDTCVPDEYIEEIFEACRMHNNHHYLFITRYPERYRMLADDGILPKEPNFWYGWTKTGPAGDSGWQWDEKGEYNTYLCLEPLLDEALGIPEGIKWVIVGAETGNRKDKIVPKFEWIKEIVVTCDYSAVPVFMVDSLREVVPEKSMRKDKPKYLDEKDIGAVLHSKIFGNCMVCDCEDRKNEMITLLARSCRGEQPKQYGFMCKSCFSEHCKKYNTEIPQLKNL
jgi:hypothetical protein